MVRASHVKILTDLGLKTFEAKIYLASLQLGLATVGRISDASGVARSFCYEVVQGLVTQGLLSPTKTTGTQQYTALPIDRLYSLQRERMERFTDALPEIRSFQEQLGERPQIQHLTGEEALAETLLDVLDHAEHGSTVRILWGSRQTLAAITDAFDFSARLLAKGLHTQVLTNAREQVANGDLSEYRWIPLNRYPIGATCIIYGTRIAYLSSVGDSFALQIDAGTAAETARAGFDLAWEAAVSN